MSNTEDLLRDAYLAGFTASAEGYNGECPFSDNGVSPLAHAAWVRDRENAIAKLVKERGGK